MGTAEARRAGVWLGVVGGLDLLGGLLVRSVELHMEVGAPTSAVLSAVAGAVLMALGFLTRRGESPAMVFAITVLILDLVICHAWQFMLAFFAAVVSTGMEEVAWAALAWVLIACLVIRSVVALTAIMWLVTALRREVA